MLQEELALRQSAAQGREAEAQIEGLRPLFEAMRREVLEELCLRECSAEQLRMCRARLLVMSEVESRLGSAVKVGRMAEARLREGV